MPAPMNQGANAYFVQKDLSHVFGTSYSEGESMISALYDMREPDQAIVYEVLDGEPGAIQEFDGAVQYDEVRQSYRKSTEEVESSVVRPVAFLSVQLPEAEALRYPSWPMPVPART